MVLAVQDAEGEVVGASDGNQGVIDRRRALPPDKQTVLRNARGDDEPRQLRERRPHV
jgi:hypothetical protein